MDNYLLFVISLIIAFLFVIWNLPVLFPEKSWTMRRRIKLAAKMQAMKPWEFFVSAYADTFGALRARRDAEEIQRAFYIFENTKPDDQYKAPSWLREYLDKIDNSPELQKSDEVSKAFSKIKEESDLRGAAAHKELKEIRAIAAEIKSRKS